jgi:1,4-alpha-glucan branching enzyme
MSSDTESKTFRLYAPGKQRVELLGDFNDWQRNKHRLTADDDGWWSIDVDLPPGRHTWRFRVDDELEFTDPCSKEVEQDEDGRWRSVIRIGEAAFDWQHDNGDYQRPDYQDLVIYELHVGDFTGGGGFSDVQDRIDHLSTLSVNAVQLMPVFARDPDDHWGYEPMFLQAPDPRFGSPDDLRRLIDALHQRSIAVILDIVLAHVHGDHPFAKLWEPEDSPYLGQDASNDNEFGFPSFDYDKPAARAFAAGVQRYWIEQYHVDGFRYDYLKLLKCQSDEDISALVEPARDARADAFLIGETLPEEPKRINDSDLDGNWHLRFSRALRAMAHEDEVDGYKFDELDEVAKIFDPDDQGYDQRSQMVNFLESHDEERLAHTIADEGFDEDQRGKKLAMLAVLLLTAPGPAMIYAGQEWGEDAEKSQDPNPLQWDLLGNEANRMLFEWYRKLIGTRRDHPALRRGNVDVEHVDNQSKTLVIRRWEDDGEVILVAANFSADQQEVDLPLPDAGRWYELTTDQHFEVDQTPHAMPIPPYTTCLIMR